MKSKPKSNKLSGDKRALIKVLANIAGLACNLQSLIDHLEKQQKENPDLNMITGHQAKAGILAVMKTFKLALLELVKGM